MPLLGISGLKESVRLNPGSGYFLLDSSKCIVYVQNSLKFFDKPLTLINITIVAFAVFSMFFGAFLLCIQHGLWLVKLAEGLVSRLQTHTHMHTHIHTYMCP